MSLAELRGRRFDLIGSASRIVLANIRIACKGECLWEANDLGEELGDSLALSVPDGAITGPTCFRWGAARLSLHFSQLGCMRPGSRFSRRGGREWGGSLVKPSEMRARRCGARRPALSDRSWAARSRQRAPLSWAGQDRPSWLRSRSGGRDEIGVGARRHAHLCGHVSADAGVVLDIGDERAGRSR